MVIVEATAAKDVVTDVAIAINPHHYKNNRHKEILMAVYFMH